MFKHALITSCVWLQDLTITIISYEKILRIAMKTQKGFIDEHKLKFYVEKAAEIIFKAAME